VPDTVKGFLVLGGIAAGIGMGEEIEKEKAMTSRPAIDDNNKGFDMIKTKSD